MRPLTLALTVLTGATGRVYEVAWQKVFATLLGSHSEATATVLAIFLAGMSAGYALFGRVANRIQRSHPRPLAARRLLRAYGLVEGSIGLFALIFPVYFAEVERLVHESSLPAGTTLVGFGADVLLVAILIGPPAIAMGATVPMLTQALSRSVEDSSRLHARVYGLNTIGAFIGALSAGYWLIPSLGLGGVIIAASVVNLAVGTSFIAMSFRRGAAAAASHPSEQRAALWCAEPWGYLTT